jgi:hypothetical protein
MTENFNEIGSTRLTATNPTVEELVVALRQFPPDAIVHVWSAGLDSESEEVVVEWQPDGVVLIWDV